MFEDDEDRCSIQRTAIEGLEKEEKDKNARYVSFSSYSSIYAKELPLDAPCLVKEVVYWALAACNYLFKCIAI